MRALPALASAALLVGSVLAGAPAFAHAPDPDHVAALQAVDVPGVGAPLQSSNVALTSSNPGEAGISGCFLKSKPLFVQSNIDSIKVYDVAKPTTPAPARDACPRPSSRTRR